MIIKSMRRKAPTFRQLVTYIDQGDLQTGSDVFVRNLYYYGSDTQLVSKQFEINYGYLPKRKNGNALYHEVIVLPEQAHLSDVRQAQILRRLADYYCRLRAPDQLAWGRVHFDTKHPHIHLMISANAYRSDKRVRLDKKTFANIQRKMEWFKETQFPDLLNVKVYRNSHSPNTPRLTNSEGELIRRTGQPSRKQSVAKFVGYCISNSRNLSEIEVNLKGQGLRLYKRGNFWGVERIASGKRYRLKTLGVADNFEHLLSLKQVHDNRADALLKQREAMEEQAREQLEKFDRDDDEGITR